MLWYYTERSRNCNRPPLLLSGQKFCLQIQKSRVPFLVLPDFLGNQFGMGPIQPREDNWLTTWMKSSVSDLDCRVDPLRWPRSTPLSAKARTNLAGHGGPSVGMVCLRAKGHGVWLFVCLFSQLLSYSFKCIFDLRQCLRLIVYYVTGWCRHRQQDIGIMDFRIVGFKLNYREQIIHWLLQ
jgi:hypothetical protein